MSTFTKEELEELRRQHREEQERQREAEKNKKIVMSSDKNVTATAKQIKDVVSEKMKWMQWGMEKGKCKTDEEVWQRITEYWSTVAATGEIPHKTDMYAYLNIDHTTFGKWRKGVGCSKERQNMVLTFDMMYNSVRDDLADRNLINQIAYIWQSKQWQGYKEPVNKVEIATKTPLDELPDIAGVEAKYLAGVPTEDIT